MKPFITKITLVLFSFVFLTQCTAFKKTIPKQVVVALTDTLFMATINSTALNAKYSTNFNSEQLVSAFLKGFKQEGKNTPNVAPQFTTDNADFILKCRYLKIEETSTVQTISDPKSPYNGKDAILNRVNVSAEFDITDQKDLSKKLMGCSNSKERSESETNNRKIDDLIAGTNKDKTEYHTKLLNDNIALTLTEDVGRRIWMPISRRIVKRVK